MHTEMWEHPSTRRNIERLAELGYELVGPNQGDLAGGDVGIGRVAEPEEILEAANRIFAGDGMGRSLLVTAGGTREPIDPVRFLGNRSSGRMGHAVADEAVRRGYEVTLVTTSDFAVHPVAKVIRVETAEEMLEAVSGVEPDVAVLAAAVADFRPVSAAGSKIPRAEGAPVIELTTTPDILASVVGREHRPFTVGFAAETGGVERAVEKARAKGVDFLVYNDVTEPGSGFGTETNRVVIIDSEGGLEELPLLSKQEVAARILDRVAAGLGQQG